jgi:Helix-turn-helix domain
MSELSKNGNAVPVSATRFAKFHLEWLPLLPTPTALRVFLVLLAHAKPQGECWPRQATIASLAGVHPRRVREALRDLEKCGALETIHKKGGRSKYKVSFLPPNEVRPDLGLSVNCTEAENRPEVRPDLGPCHGPDLGPSRNRPGDISINKTSRVRAHGGEEKTTGDEGRTTSLDTEKAPLAEDALADLANDLADTAFKATLGFTEEQRRANVARLATLMRRDARFGTTG